jgi:hypothetical protein
MRLTEKELTIIRKTFQEYFSSSDHLWLFGSRVDDAKKGGDIDFYIETMESDVSTALAKRSKFVVALYMSIGDQKIDVVLNQLPLKGDLLIYEEARATGVQLI